MFLPPILHRPAAILGEPRQPVVGVDRDRLVRPVEHRRVAGMVRIESHVRAGQSLRREPRLDHRQFGRAIAIDPVDLGMDPRVEPENYERSDLTPLAAGLERPLLLVHGMADDNVVVAHTLRLSRALLEAGRAHRVVPLSGVTHMTPQENVAANLLALEVDFFREALGG